MEICSDKHNNLNDPPTPWSIPVTSYSVITTILHTGQLGRAQLWLAFLILLVVRSILHGGPLTRIMWDVGEAQLKDPLLLIGKSSPYSGGSRFPLSIPQWFCTKRLMLHDDIKTFSAFFQCIVVNYWKSH